MYNKKLIGFFLIALILAVCIGTASASENTTLTSVNEEKTFTDIQTAIDNASENDTIELEGTYKSQGSEIKIDKAIKQKRCNIRRTVQIKHFQYFKCQRLPEKLKSDQFKFIKSCSKKSGKSDSDRFQLYKQYNDLSGNTNPLRGL